MRGLEGKVVVVAGGAAGIGAATAHRVAQEGAAVVVGDIVGDRAEATAAAIRSGGGRGVAVTYDATDEASLRSLAATALDEFGGLDGWHNNAADTSITGTATDLHHDAATLPIEVWHRSFAVNVQGYLHGIRAAVPLLLRRGGGAFVHTASDGAFAGLPNLAAYAASKSAVLSLSRHVAARWGRQGIRSNVVSPGVILTEIMKATMTQEQIDGLMAMTPSTRAGDPDDIAAAVAFLLSDDASYVNGQVLRVNGGAGM